MLLESFFLCHCTLFHPSIHYFFSEGKDSYVPHNNFWEEGITIFGVLPLYDTFSACTYLRNIP